MIWKHVTNLNSKSDITLLVDICKSFLKISHRHDGIKRFYFVPHPASTWNAGWNFNNFTPKKVQDEKLFCCCGRGTRENR